MTSASIVDRVRDGVVALTRPTGPLPRPTRRNLAFDASLALVHAIVVVRYSVGNVTAPNVLQDVDGRLFPVEPPPPTTAQWAVPVLAALIASAALVVRRRWPLTVMWVLIGVTLATQRPSITAYACVIAAYSAAAYGPYRVPTLASLLVAALAVSAFADADLPGVPDGYVPFVVLVPIVVAADAMRAWRRRAEQDSARLAALEREQIEALRRAAEHERARIARELHDVVTHNVSVMVIQAGAARQVLHTEPEQARQALLAVEAGGRAAMAELRQVMGLLTMDGPDPAGTVDLAPQPGLDRLEALVGRVRDTGVPVAVTVLGEVRPVPSGVELTAYRVIQEALTNMVKHAVGAVATVTVEYAPDRLRVEVTDTGGTPGPAAGTGAGHGLVGLRERVAVYGGSLHAGHRPAGGYRVTALIPLGAG